MLPFTHEINEDIRNLISYSKVYMKILRAMY